MTRRRGRLVTAAVVIVLLVGAGGYIQWAKPHGISLAHPFGVRHRPASGPQDNGAATSTTTVTRRSLSQTANVSGTLGYAGDYTVLAPGHGTITWLPEVGRVYHQGQVLYRVDGKPVVLLYGSTPAYRALAEGASAADVTGRDVRQLNHDLVALGYVDGSDVDWAWNEFSWATRAGIEKLQEHLGVEQTGTLGLGDYVFLPSAARVTSRAAKLGGPSSGQVLTASSTTRQVTVHLEADRQSEVKVGDRVQITLPNNQTTQGRVSSVGRVATTPSGSGGQGGDGSDSPTVTVQITPTHPRATGTLDQAPVQVLITSATVHHVLAVPVAALVALAGGGYAVEVVDADGSHRLEGVHPGLFDDVAGLVEVSGSGLAAGQHVVVPSS